MPQILVPRVVGQTEASRAAKAGSSGRRTRTDEPSFMAACPEIARSFFTDVLNEARERNLEVHLAQVGFSVRLRKEMHGDTTSFLYGFPPTDTMSPEPLFQIYLKAVSDPAEAERLRAAVQQAGPFYGGGQFLLSVSVIKETLEAARAGLEIMFRWEEQQRKPGKAHHRLQNLPLEAGEYPRQVGIGHLFGHNFGRHPFRSRVIPGSRWSRRDCWNRSCLRKSLPSS